MQTIVITGASDGIGAAAARQLSEKGHVVVLVGRSHDKTAALARDLKAPFHLADYARLGDVKRLADELQAYERIDVLANNAGVIMGARQITVEGFEATFQVNHLAGYLLTRLLLGKLAFSRAKVIQTTSLAANVWGKGFDIDDLNNARAYSPTSAYGRGKLANILFTRELDRRHRADGISAVAFHPGFVRSNFAEASPLLRLFYHTPLRYLGTISSETSARRLTALAEGTPGTDWQPGEVYSKRRRMPVAFRDDNGTVARRLWEESSEMVKMFLE
jgi:NAD(P)-dependent dehydrogenase (short-subunit alcohol dehydrogenase family)